MADHDRVSSYQDAPPYGGGNRHDDHVVRDVINRRLQTRQDPPKLGPALTQARREQLLDNAVRLDDALLDVAVAAMATMSRLREACPEIANRHRLA
jgi:hypothetical protein